MTIYSLSEYKLETGIRLCFDKAERLANDAELIIKNSGNSSHALVLYEFAVEEYGKGELLRECKSKQNTTKDGYDVDKSIFSGWGSHQKKSRKAIETLPENCKEIDIGIGVTSEYYYTTDSFERSNKRRSSSRTKRLGGNAIISIGPYLTGLFTTSGLNIEKDNVDLEKHIRWPALYIDWDDESKDWKEEIIPYAQSLSDAISSFKKHLINARTAKTF